MNHYSMRPASQPEPQAEQPSATVIFLLLTYSDVPFHNGGPECGTRHQAIVDMSKDGPRNIDGAEEAKKMIKRCPLEGTKQSLASNFTSVLYHQSVWMKVT